MMRRMNVRALSEPIPFQMGLQVPCSVCAQAPPESHLWADPAAVGTDLPCAGPTEGMPDSGRAPHADHVHMCIAILPKHPVASVIGFLKGKSAIAIARLLGKDRTFTGEHFWARGY